MNIIFLNHSWIEIRMHLKKPFQPIVADFRLEWVEPATMHVFDGFFEVYIIYSRCSTLIEIPPFPFNKALAITLA